MTVASSTFSQQFMTKVMLSYLPFYFGSLYYSIQCGPRSDCSILMQSDLGPYCLHAFIMEQSDLGPYCLHAFIMEQSDLGPYCLHAN